jgi:phospholipid transport system substrate-binding protein
MNSRRIIPDLGLALAVSLLFLTSILAPGQANAGQSEPKEFILDLGDRAIRTLASDSTSESSRRVQFRKIFLDGFDVNAISRFAIGRYWRKASKAQKTEYQQLFTDFIVNTWAKRFNQYSGEKLVVTGERAVKGKDTIVHSNIVRPEGAPVKVDWRVRNRKGKLQVVDIIIERVSMLITQREEFASVIRRNGDKVDGLISELREKTR